LLACFKGLLLAWTGRNDICVATPMANRSQLMTECVIGPLANTMLIRTRIDMDLSFEKAMTYVRESVLNASTRQELPFDILTPRLMEAGTLEPTSLVQVCFDLRNAFRRPLELSHIVVGPFGDRHREGQPRLPLDHTLLSVTLKEVPSGITGSLSYKKDLFRSKAIKQWVAHYKTILAKAAATPEISLRELLER
jgi:non-ribosomal peptide synthetase component F